MKRNPAAIVLGLIATSLMLALVPITWAQGPHGGDPHGGPPLAALLLDTGIHTSLALDATQEAAWVALDNLDAALQAQRESTHDALQSLVATQAAQAVPDLAAIEAARLGAREADAAAMASMDNQSAALYASLGDTQKATVIAAWKAMQSRSRIARLAR